MLQATYAKRFPCHIASMCKTEVDVFQACNETTENNTNHLYFVLNNKTLNSRVSVGDYASNFLKVKE